MLPPQDMLPRRRQWSSSSSMMTLSQDGLALHKTSQARIRRQQRVGVMSEAKAMARAAVVAIQSNNLGYSLTAAAAAFARLPRPSPPPWPCFPPLPARLHIGQTTIKESCSVWAKQEAGGSLLRLGSALCHAGRFAPMIQFARRVPNDAPLLPFPPSTLPFEDDPASPCPPPHAPRRPVPVPLPVAPIPVLPALAFGSHPLKVRPRLLLLLALELDRRRNRRRRRAHPKELGHQSLLRASGRVGEEHGRRETRSMHCSHPCELALKPLIRFFCSARAFWFPSCFCRFSAAAALALRMASTFSCSSIGSCQSSLCLNEEAAIAGLRCSALSEVRVGGARRKRIAKAAEPSLPQWQQIKG